MLKINNNSNNQNIKILVNEQTTLVEEILTNLNVTVDSSTGSTKNKLQINNTNLQKITDKQVIEDAIISPYLNAEY